MARKKVLVIDDDTKVLEVLKLYLEKDGCEVLTSDSGIGGLRLARETHPDLVVLDILLPELSGFQVCRAIRNESDVPIIMLTGLTTEKDRITGLDLGADDYVPKPFSPRELAARVRAVLRRMPESGLERGLSKINCGGITIDLTGREVLREGIRLNLTPTEFKILVIMAKQPGKVFSRAELINRVFDYDFDSFEHTIDTHITNLRKKLEPEPDQPRYILTVFGVGYKCAAGEG
jgi:DNA-binding response OmpR family regulator